MLQEMHVTIAEGVTVGARSRVEIGCRLGRDVVGADCRRQDGTSLGAGTRLGDRVRVQSGSTGCAAAPARRSSGMPTVVPPSCAAPGGPRAGSSGCTPTPTGMWRVRGRPAQRESRRRSGSDLGICAQPPRSGQPARTRGLELWLRLDEPEGPTWSVWPVCTRTAYKLDLSRCAVVDAAGSGLFRPRPGGAVARLLVVGLVQQQPELGGDRGGEAER